MNFDEARFTTMLQQAADYEACLKKMLKEKGVAAPAIPKAQELGWTGEHSVIISLSATAAYADRNYTHSTAMLL